VQVRVEVQLVAEGVHANDQSGLGRRLPEVALAYCLRRAALGGVGRRRIAAMARARWR